MTPTTECPFKVGQSVRIKDPKGLARELFDLACGPDDPNARLAMDLNDWWRQEPLEVTISQVQPDLNGWYLHVHSVQLDNGDEFGIRSSDVEVVNDD